MYVGPALYDNFYLWSKLPVWNLTSVQKEVFCSFEVFLYIIPVPARSSMLLPAIIVKFVTSDIHHVVDTAAPSKYSAMLCSNLLGQSRLLYTGV